MSFLRAKTINGKLYYYLVENVRQGTKIKQFTLHYFGDACPSAREVVLRRLIISLKRELTRRNVALIAKKLKPTKGRYGKGKKRYDPVMEVTWAGGKMFFPESMGVRPLRAILKLLLDCP